MCAPGRSAPAAPIVFCVLCWSTEPTTFSWPAVIFAEFFMQRLPMTYKGDVTFTEFWSVMSHPLKATPLPVARDIT